MTRLLLFTYLDNIDTILPCYRKMALWRHTDAIRDIWGYEFWGTEEGEELLLALAWWVFAESTVSEQGKTIAGNRID